MVRQCRRFDRYRDGELKPAERAEFEAHLALCEDCSMKTRLLNSVVMALEREEVGSAATTAKLIAARALQQPASWDEVLVSWLRPAPAWSAVALLLALLAFTWGVPVTQQVSLPAEYEPLISPAEQIDSVDGPSGSLTDDELESWLGQRGSRQ